VRLNRHRFICGITGSGKTTYAVKIFNRARGLRIFINTQYEKMIDESTSFVVNSYKELITALEGKDIEDLKLVYDPPTDEEMFTDVEKLRDILFSVGKIMAGEERRIWCYLFVDEVHRFGENLNRWFTQGMRYGIVCVAISQRPADTSHTILTQAQDHVIFKCSTYEAPYFQKYRIPYEEFSDWLDKNYHYVVFDGRDVKKFIPIKI